MRHGLPTRDRRRRKSGEEGFGITEVMVAAVVLVIIVSALGMTLAGSLNLSRTNKNRTVAANLAQQDIDQIRTALQNDFDDNDYIGTTVAPKTVGKATYSVSRATEWVTSNTGANLCENPPPSPSNPTTGLAYIKVTTRVSWPNMGGTPPVIAETLVTPPVRSFDQNSGHIPVQVTRDNGVPASGVDVRVTAPNGTVTNQSTTPEGCAFFGFLPILPAGQTYTVSLIEPGWVDLQGNPTPTASAGVSVGATAPPVAFTYDEAGGLELTVTGVDVSGAPDPTVPVPALPVLLGNTGLTGQFRTVPPAPAPLAVANLFPFADGYTAWAGSCLDNDPQAYPVGRDQAHIAPKGGVGIGVVRVPTLRVRVVRHNHGNNPRPGRTVRARHAPDTRCDAGANVVLGVTDANGEVVVALPFGTYEIQVDGESWHGAGGSWPDWTIAPPYGVNNIELEVD